MASAPFILRFDVADPGVFAPGAEEAAHLIGSDDGPLRGQVRVTKRGVRCGFVDDEIAALALPVRAGRAGTLLLQTCLLPPREQPYGLLLELARHRIKHFIQKCEEWQMWDPALSRGAMRLWDEARGVFAAALLSSDPIESERLARRALERAIESSERLAVAHAEILLHRRFGSRAAGSIVLGTVLRPATPPEPRLERLLAQDMDVLHLPMVWRAIEPKPGVYTFEAIDRWIKWAGERRKPIMAGPLIDLGDDALPDHVRALRGEYERFRDLAHDHVDRVVTRYGGAVGIWNVGRGFHTNEGWVLSVEQMVDLARRAIVAIRQRQRKANTLVELGDTFGRGDARGNGALLPWRYLELLHHEGIPVSAAGLRIVLGRDGEIARDLFQISALFDRFVGRETRLVVSAFGVPAAPTDERCGSWHDGWTADAQASWAGRLAGIALSKPFIETLFWAEASDAGGGNAAPFGLFDGSGGERPVLAKLLAFRRRLRQPIGPRAPERDVHPEGQPEDGIDSARVADKEEM